MSVNPAAITAAAAAAASNDAAVEQFIAAELDALAADAQVLQSQVTTGQVVTAQVLPPNGLTDLISILGTRVAAALPPNMSPGDTFTAQVTGFDGPQILLQVLSTVEPGQAPAPPPAGTALIQTSADDTPPSALELAATRPLLPEGVTPSVAPPPAVFVAASVRQAQAPTAPAPATPANLTPPPPSQVIAQPLSGLADIEARLAAARAGSIGVNVPAAAPAPAGSAPAPAPLNGQQQQPAPPPALPNAGGAATPPAPAPPPPGIMRSFSFPPPITQSARFADPAAGTPVTTTSGNTTTTTITTANTAPPAPAGLAAYRDPAALVRALNLPVTPTNVAAARLAIATPQRLPAALATLESALPQIDDSRVATLRTLTAFFGRIEPSSPQLAAQISAYVDNVVSGNETKLVQLLNGQQAAETPAAAPDAAPAAGAQAPAAPAGTLPPIVQEPALPVVAMAQAAERAVAMTFDLKTQLLSLVSAPPAGTEENTDLVPAASSALSAITAVQINAAQAMNATPQTMQFTLPMWLGTGYAQAQIAVDRDAPEPGGNRSLDGDNFHIAFVLDTKNLGTVTVDLQTVGRAFTLAVKTENEGTAKRFADSLDRLTGRLETLRYRVNSAEATVAPRGTAAATPAPAVPEVIEPEDDGGGSAVNLRA